MDIYFNYFSNVYLLFQYKNIFLFNTNIMTSDFALNTLLIITAILVVV